MAEDPTPSTIDAPALRTTFGETARAIADAPSQGFSAWARTTAGVVALLISMQLLTGLLLAFYYVPSAESAHVTTSYIEKVIGGGSFIRALHAHGSRWLPLALALHLAQMLWRAGYRRKPIAWIACVALLALSLAAAATGYSLPWDARAYASTHVAEGIARGLPLVGNIARMWLIGGAEPSTLTVSRFYALHVFITPFLILLIIAARLFFFRESGATTSTHDEQIRAWWRAQLARNALAAGSVFIALSLYASKIPAPLGPTPEVAASNYLPRPGAQFLWLFQMLKYLPGAAASLAAFLVPGLLFIALAALPFLRLRSQSQADPRQRIGAALFIIALLLVAGLTTAAYLADTRDPHVRTQLAQQATEEEAFRQAPFIPQRSSSKRTSAAEQPEQNHPTSDKSSVQSSDSSSVPPPPDAYTRQCAKCHGAHGEGVRPSPSLIGISKQPNRSVEDIIKILDNPSAYGLEKPMNSFATKLTADEKLQIAEWVEGLK